MTRREKLIKLNGEMDGQYPISLKVHLGKFVPSTGDDFNDTDGSEVLYEFIYKVGIDISSDEYDSLRDLYCDISAHLMPWIEKTNPVICDRLITDFDAFEYDGMEGFHIKFTFDHISANLELFHEESVKFLNEASDNVIDLIFDKHGESIDEILSIMERELV